MRWGIVFDIPATFNQDLWPLPPPSKMDRWQRWDGTKMINVVYHFKHNPQTWKEWQIVASVKVQLKNCIRGIEFREYEDTEIDGSIYTVGELSAHFKDFVAFPESFIAGTAYKTLCIYAKRLHYEDKLSVEKLISTSLWLSDSHKNIESQISDKQKKRRRPMVEGFHQCIKRAFSAYKFAEVHKDDWKQKLAPGVRHRILSESAFKSAEVKRAKCLGKRERAKEMKSYKKTYQEIADILGVSSRTIKRWVTE